MNSKLLVVALASLALTACQPEPTTDKDSNEGTTTEQSQNGQVPHGDASITEESITIEKQPANSNSGPDQNQSTPEPTSSYDASMTRLAGGDNNVSTSDDSSAQDGMHGSSDSSDNNDSSSNDSEESGETVD